MPMEKRRLLGVQSAFQREESPGPSPAGLLPNGSRFGGDQIWEF